MMMYFGVCKDLDNKHLCKLSDIYHLTAAEGGLRRSSYLHQSNEIPHSNIQSYSCRCWDFIFFLQLHHELHLRSLLPVPGMTRAQWSRTSDKYDILDGAGQLAHLDLGKSLRGRF